MVVWPVPLGVRVRFMSHPGPRMHVMDCGVLVRECSRDLNQTGKTGAADDRIPGRRAAPLSPAVLSRELRRGHGESLSQRQAERWE